MVVQQKSNYFTSYCSVKVSILVKINCFFFTQVIDPIAPRYTALESYDTVPVLVKNVKSEKLEVPKHPKNEEVGKKVIWRHSRVLIDYIDAELLKENENATFINWGNLLIKKINK